MNRMDITIDLDDVDVTAELRRVGAGPYQSWHMTFRFGGSEINFEAGDSKDIERLLDSLQHDLCLLLSGAKRTVDGRSLSSLDTVPQFLNGGKS